MNKITKLFGIKYPIIQGGMIWCSGWELASAVSNSGGLGLLGSGSMYPEVLVKHIKKCQESTSNPFGVNIPLIYPDIDSHLKNIVENGVKIVFTSAGDPSKHTAFLKENGVTVVHVTSSLKFARKAQDSGVDAVVVEGFEAGGHNGKEEITTMCLVSNVSRNISLPIIAAGGIGCGRSMLAAFCLGADGVQIGSRFAVSEESSAHINFKNEVLRASESDTILTLKDLTAVRLLKNDFYKLVNEAENRGDSIKEMRNLLGKGRSKKGMFEGDLINGELEIGQVSASIKKIQTASEIIDDIISEFNLQKEKVNHFSF